MIITNVVNISFALIFTLLITGIESNCIQGDFTGNGEIDLGLQLLGAGWQNYVVYQTDDGFSKPVFSSIATRNQYAPNSYAYFYEDFNKDGITDEAIQQISSSGWSVSTAICTGVTNSIKRTTTTINNHNININVGPTFNEPVSSSLPLSISPANFNAFLTVGDWNGDKAADVAFVQLNTEFVISSSLNNGAGAFDKIERNSLLQGQFNDYFYAVSDINADGFDDVIAYQFSSFGWTTLAALSKGDGTFTFAEVAQISTNSDFGKYNFTFYIDHFSGNKFPDVVASSFDSERGWFSYVALGDGTGKFSSLTKTEHVTTRITGFSELFKGTWDSFNRVDLLLSNRAAATSTTSAWTSYVARSNTDATFEPVVTSNLGDAPMSGTTFVGDYNSDSNVDISRNHAGVDGWYTYIALAGDAGHFAPADKTQLDSANLNGYC